MPDNVHDPGTGSRSCTAYGAVLDMILDGRLPGGTIIQERRLAENLGVSRTPLREALGRLEGEGYLTRQGRSPVVTSITVKEVMQIISLRRLLEGEAVRLATGTLEQAVIERLIGKLRAMGGPSAVTDAEHWALDDEVHLTIAAASGNDLLERLIADVRRKTRMFGLKRIPERFEPGRTEHLAILEAMAEGDAGRARERMLQHLDNVKDGILRRIAGG